MGVRYMHGTDPVGTRTRIWVQWPALIKQWNKCYSPLSNNLPEPKLLIDISSDNKNNNTHLHQNHNIAGSGYCLQYIALSEQKNLDYVVQQPRAADPASNDP